MIIDGHERKLHILIINLLSKCSITRLTTGASTIKHGRSIRLPKVAGKKVFIFLTFLIHLLISMLFGFRVYLKYLISDL